MASSVVPGCSLTTRHKVSNSSSELARLGTGWLSPSLWVEDRVVERPSPPAASESSSRWTSVSTSSGVDSRLTASSPSTKRRRAQCPTRNPALTPMRPSRPSRYWPKLSHFQSTPLSSAPSGMPSTLAIIRRV